MMIPEPDEDLRMRLVDKSCLERDDGFPECIGAAARGEQGCTCGLHPGQHDEAVLVAWAHFHERGGKACHDCAFRRGSPEMQNGIAMSIAEGDQAFYCHQGMPVDGRGCDAELGEFRPDDPRRYPPCAGLAAIRRRSSP